MRSKAQVISLLYSLICDMENIGKDYLLRRWESNRDILYLL